MISNSEQFIFGVFRLTTLIYSVLSHIPVNKLASPISLFSSYSFRLLSLEERKREVLRDYLLELL